MMITITDDFIKWVHNYNKKAIKNTDDDIIFNCMQAEDWLIKHKGEKMKFKDFKRRYSNAYYNKRG